MDLGLIITLISGAITALTSFGKFFGPEKQKVFFSRTALISLGAFIGILLMYLVTSFDHMLEVNKYELEVSQLKFKVEQLETELAKANTGEKTSIIKEEKVEPVVTVKKSPPESTGSALVATVEEVIAVKEKKPLFNGELYLNVAAIYKDSNFDQRVKAVISSGPQKIRRDGLTLFEEVSLENGGFRYVLSVIDIHDRHIKIKSEKYRL